MTSEKKGRRLWPGFVGIIKPELRLEIDGEGTALGSTVVAGEYGRVPNWTSAHWYRSLGIA